MSEGRNCSDAWKVNGPQQFRAILEGKNVNTDKEPAPDCSKKCQFYPLKREAQGENI